MCASNVEVGSLLKRLSPVQSRLAAVGVATLALVAAGFTMLAAPSTGLDLPAQLTDWAWVARMLGRFYFLVTAIRHARRALLLQSPRDAFCRFAPLGGDALVLAAAVFSFWRQTDSRVLLAGLDTTIPALLTVSCASLVVVLWSSVGQQLRRRRLGSSSLEKSLDWMLAAFELFAGATAAGSVLYVESLPLPHHSITVWLSCTCPDWA